MGIVIEKSGDRRIHDRVGVDVSVSSRSTGNPIGRAVNLCSGGMFIETQNRYEPGTKIIIDCSLPLNTLSLRPIAMSNGLTIERPAPSA